MRRAAKRGDDASLNGCSYPAKSGPLQHDDAKEKRGVVVRTLRNQGLYNGTDEKTSRVELFVPCEIRASTTARRGGRRDARLFVPCEIRASTTGPVVDSAQDGCSYPAKSGPLQLKTFHRLPTAGCSYPAKSGPLQLNSIISRARNILRK